MSIELGRPREHTIRLVKGEDIWRLQESKIEAIEISAVDVQML